MVVKRGRGEYSKPSPRLGRAELRWVESKLSRDDLRLEEMRMEFKVERKVDDIYTVDPSVSLVD